MAYMKDRQPHSGLNPIKHTSIDEIYTTIRDTFSTVVDISSNYFDSFNIFYT